MKKEEGSSMLHTVIVLFIFTIGVIITIYIYSMRLTSVIKTQVEHDLALSNLSAATIDVKKYASTNKIVFIDVREAYDDFIYSFTTNMGLEEMETGSNLYEPKYGSYFEGEITEVKVVSFILYNVDESEITKKSYDVNTGSVETETYTWTQTTPDGTEVEDSPTLYSKIQITLQLPGGITQTVTRENSVAIVLT